MGLIGLIAIFLVFFEIAIFKERMVFMKKILFVVLSLVFFFACNGPQNDGEKPSPKKEEVKVNFSVDGGTGGTLTAKIKGETNTISTGKKVAKDSEVVFTATVEDSTYSVESWKLDGNLVNGTNLEYKLKITKEVNVVVKFKKNGGSPQPKDIQIDKIILGYPNISPRDGKTVLGKDLNENTTIDDFEVPDAGFPVQVYHMTGFTVEEVFVSFNGGAKEQLTSTIQKTVLEKKYTLVENHKTPIVVDITGEGYKPLKLTFNVTYKKATKKYVDDLTNITITTTKSGKKLIYGSVGENPITKLTGGTYTINVSTDEPSIELIVNKGEGGQPSADIKVDDQKLNVDFENGKHKLTFKTPKLTKGSHSVKITITKEGYEPGEYHFNLMYKPLLTFKSLTINGKTYNDKEQIKQIILEANAPNPVSISGEVNEEGATISFKKQENKTWGDFTPPLNLKEEDKLSLRMYAKLDGYTTTFFGFGLERKKGQEAIFIRKIEIDGKQVTQNGCIEVEKFEAKVKLEITLKQKYENISFKINDASITPIFDTSGMIATFNDFGVTKDGELQVKIELSAPNFANYEETITIKHKTLPPSSAYIIEVGVAPWEYDQGAFGWLEALRKKGANWEGSLSAAGPHQFTIKIDTKNKDITDVTIFKLYMKDANSETVYFDKITGKKEGEKNIVFESSKDTLKHEIHLPVGTSTLDVKLYYGEEVVESCQFIVKR